MSGWIKIHRKMAMWEWSDDPNMVALWFHILLEANYEPKNWRGLTIARGQLVFGLEAWVEKTGISRQSLRTCILRLKSTGELTGKSTNKFTVLTIVKYEEYQCNDSELTGKSTGSLTYEQHSTNIPSTAPKEVKKERSKEYMCDFDSFWGLYPKKKAKPKALQSYVQARGKTDHQTIMVGLTRYAAEQTDPQYTAHASTWLNQERWNDEEQKRKPSNPNQEKRSNKEVL